MPSADGTLLRAWSNEQDGVPVLLCNGLGASPAAWSALLAPDSGFRVVGWDHRGLGGSERPADPERVRVEDHVADARAVLDAFDLPPALVVGWSLGVNIAFELALADRQRARGVLAVAGVPGGSFSSLFGSLGVPRRLRSTAGRHGSRLLPVVGPFLPLVTAGLQQWQPLLSMAGADPGAPEAARLTGLLEVAHEFAGQDWAWFRHAAVAAAEHAPLDLSPLAAPATFLAGRYDVLVDAADVRAAAAAVPGARYREYPTSHFLPLERPDVVLDELRRLAEVCAARG
ncbi:alpha/beta fold hydrolase [Geodermatophilus sp. SYSU D01186]